MVPNPNLPVPKKPQVFETMVLLLVDSDDGKVTIDQVNEHLKPALQSCLDTLSDSVDRNSENPMPFAFHGAVVTSSPVRAIEVSLPADPAGLSSYERDVIAAGIQLIQVILAIVPDVDTRVKQTALDEIRRKLGLSP